jgi:holliday junction DNA helicase RuvA
VQVKKVNEMIGALRGKVILIAEDYILLEVAGGVAYMVYLSAKQLANLSLDEAVFLFIHTNVREDAIQLYGFAGADEYQMFLLITSVQGVGSKMALNVLSVFSAEELRMVLMAQDVNALTRAHGVGKKLAERMVTELKTKIASFGSNFVQQSNMVDDSEKGLGDRVQTTKSVKSTKNSESTEKSAANNLINDAVSALENLGYGRVDAMRAASSAKAAGAEDLGEIIRQALKLL